MMIDSKGKWDMIYLDNAATTKVKPKEVVDAVVYALNNFGNSSRGVYGESLSADRVVYEARKKISNMFNVGNARQVAFSKNATESLNIAINGLIDGKDHIITSVMEHNSVLRPINYLKSKGTLVDYIGLNDKGKLNYFEVEALIKENTKAIILTHASNVTGNINDIGLIGKICRKNNILFIVDASQTAGAFDIDMVKMNIDVLCFTCHKSLHAPQGVGCLCVRDNVYIRPLIVGGSGSHSYDEFHPDKMPIRLEAGTLNSHGIAGLNSALDYILEKGMDSLTNKSMELAKYFYKKVSELEKIKIYGDFSDDYRAPIVSINIEDMDSSQVSSILYAEYGISTRPGAHCAPLIHRALGTVNQGMVRFSFSYTNTFEEVDEVIEALKNIINL